MSTRPGSLRGKAEKTAPGGSRAEEIIERIRRSNEIPQGKDTKPLPAKSTVGIVLEGTKINIIVPGSPSSKEVNGERIEPGDVVKAIDGKAVTTSDVITKLRGQDKPGTKVKLTLEKAGGKGTREMELTRADMRSVMNIKDLYMALGELNTVSREPTAEELQPIVEQVDACVSNVLGWMHLSHDSLTGSNADLEAAVRKLAEDSEQGAAAQADRGKAERELEEAKKELERALGKVKALEAAAMESQRDGSRATEAVKKAREAQEEEKRAKNQLAKERDLVKDLTKEAKGLRGELAEAVAGAEAARAEAARLEAESRRRVEAVEERAAKQVQALEARGRLEREEAARKGAEGGGDARRAEVAEQQARYLEEAVKEWQDKANQADFELQRERVRVEAKGKEAEAAKKEAVGVRRELKAAVEGENMLRKRIQALEGSWEARHGHDQQLGALRHENDHLRKAVESLREERREARETIAAQFSELQAANDALSLVERQQAPRAPLVTDEALAGAGGKRARPHGEVWVLQRELCAAQRTVVALEAEVRRMNTLLGSRRGLAERVAAALPERGPWLNGRTEDIWQVVACAGLAFIGGALVRGPLAPAVGPRAVYVGEVAAAVLFVAFSLLAALKLALLAARRASSPPTPLVSLPEGAPLLAATPPHTHSQRPPSAHEPALDYPPPQGAHGHRQGPFVVEAARTQPAAGVGEEGPPRAPARSTWTGRPVVSTWTGSSARGGGATPRGDGFKALGGEGQVPPQGQRGSARGGGARVSALKGGGSYGAVDFSMV